MTIMIRAYGLCWRILDELPIEQCPMAWGPREDITKGIHKTGALIPCQNNAQINGRYVCWWEVL